MESLMIGIFSLMLLVNFGNAIICPGGKHECPKTIFSETTCCKVPDGSYGCCPLPNAVCCDDHIHCCGHGYVCHDGNCKKSDQDFSATNQSLLISGNKIVCPDKEHTCPSSSTCCELGTRGKYGCCPMPDAVCCSDGVHCCPHGSECDLVLEQCVGNEVMRPDGIQNIPFSTFVKAARILNIICPGGEYQCPGGSTCCQLPNGTWGCCPFDHATCCPDHIHCCPQGMKCDPGSQSCHQGERNITWFENKPAFMVLKSRDVICPGGTYKCPDGTTCCQLPNETWGCCPFDHATCCPDHIHCCPQGMECDPGSQSCHQGERNITWFENKPAFMILKSKDVICPGGTYKCPDGTTCCQSSSGQWGCCPYPDAVCCTDHKHCCPSGYQCDIVSQQCTKGSKYVSLLKKFPAKP